MNYLKIFVTFLVAALSTICAFSQAQSNIFPIATGDKIRVDIYKNDIFRIQLNRDGVFNQSLMERYQLLNDQMTPDGILADQNDSSFILETTAYRLFINKQNGNINLLNKGTAKVLKQIAFNTLSNTELLAFDESIKKKFSNLKKWEAIIGDTTKKITTNNPQSKKKKYNPSLVKFSLNPDERFYGAGAASRENIQHRGELLRIWATYQKSDMVTPFIMSTEGWGIYNNTTLINYFDVGNFHKNDLLVYNNEEKIDFFLFLGNSMYDIIDKYTFLTGRPYLLPSWAYGLAFGGNTMENQMDIMNDAVKFREEKIPCDIFWIEPQWMATRYDLSTNKSWNQDKFPGEPYWEEKNNKKKYEQPYMFIGRLHKMGYKLALWLCVDHDPSIVEEDEIAKKEGKPLSGQEPWFQHLTKFIDQGVDGFKLDPGRTLDEHPDRNYYNGLTDSAMHNMNQILMPKQYYTTFRNHTGKRSFHHYCGAYAGTQRWAASTSGDNGGGRDALYDQLNLGISGFVNTSADVMEVTNRTFDPAKNLDLSLSGMHLGFFLPWVQINSWYNLHHPWYLSNEEKETITFYAQLRNQLHPYIYSAAIEGSLTGKPILRAMPLEYPNDANVNNMVYQYMFGQNFLVGVFNDSVYLPKGNWINYWTGKTVTGGRRVDAEVPKDKGGPLFVKSGAIIPFKKLSQYIDEIPNDTLVLRIYPEGESSYQLLRDDGYSFDYEKGKIATTSFTCIRSGNAISFVVEPAVGSYNNMPKNMSYKIEMNIEKKPTKVTLDKKTTSQWSWNNGVLNMVITTDLSSSKRLDIVL